jgi:hypothetical protein
LSDFGGRLRLGINEIRDGFRVIDSEIDSLRKNRLPIADRSVEIDDELLLGIGELAPFHARAQVICPP